MLKKIKKFSPKYRFEYNKEPDCNKDFMDIALDQLDSLWHMLETKDYVDEHELMSNVELAKRALEQIKL